tara:strand:- start:7304 stop:7735 length:432 start_codon:yes stop_codon:yes gene_type:complete
MNEKPQPSYYPPQMQNDTNRIDVNLIAMLLWQALLTGTAVAVSHMDWYLPGAGPAEMGLQYGLICFGFLCTAMVLFHVGGVRDSLAMRAEFSKENQVDKWMRTQARLQQRRATKQQYWNNPAQTNQPQQFGVIPTADETPKSE